jgi:hypothetical protein
MIETVGSYGGRTGPTVWLNVNEEPFRVLWDYTIATLCRNNLEVDSILGTTSNGFIGIKGDEKKVNLSKDLNYRLSEIFKQFIFTRILEEKGSKVFMFLCKQKYPVLFEDKRIYRSYGLNSQGFFKQTKVNQSYPVDGWQISFVVIKND